MSRILIVEDEDHLAAGLKLNLEAEGFTADVEDNGEAALARLVDGSAAENPFDVVLLDVMLPGLDGFEVVRRAARGAPVRPGHAVDGALAYRRRPPPDSKRAPTTICPSRSICPFFWHGSRGCSAAAGGCRGDEAGQAPEADEYRFAGRHIDFRNQVLRRNGAEQPLTLMEGTLLRHLVEHAGETVSRQTLLEEVWGVRQDTDTRTVDNFVARLRRYIETEPAHPRHLLTVRGVGYRFVEEPDDAR